MKLKQQAVAQAQREQSSNKRKQHGYKDKKSTKKPKSNQSKSKEISINAKPNIGRISSPRCVLCVATIGVTNAKQSMYINV